jgi:hypothetical protein
MRQNYSKQNQNKMLDFIEDHMISIKTTFVQLGFSSDEITADKKVHFNTDLLKQKHRYLYRK